LHPKHKEILTTRYLNASPQTVCVMKSFFNKLPDPDSLTREWVIDFISSFSNLNTRFNMFKCVRIALKELDKLDLIKGISVKPQKSSIKRKDLLTNQDISHYYATARPLFKEH
jgi:hypothetical protein